MGASDVNGSHLKNIQKHVDRILLAEYAPAGVIVDDAMRVLQVRGETGDYLQIPPGEPTTDLTRLLRPGLLAALRSGIRKARLQNSPVKETGLRVKGATGVRNVALRVSPIRDQNSKEPCFLVLFDVDSTRHRASTAGRQKQREIARKNLEAGRRRSPAAGTRTKGHSGLHAIDHRIAGSRSGGTAFRQ